MKNKVIKIGNRLIGLNQPVFVIAEAGVNHNGSLSKAKKLIDAACICGVDAIKFQTFRAEDLASISAVQADYQKKGFKTTTQLKMLKKLELSAESFKELFKYCKAKKIIFLSTPFDAMSARFLYYLGLSAFKLSSGDLNNPFLIKQIAGYKKPIILSTGMSYLSEVNQALNWIYSTGNRKVILLHCVSNYPARYSDINLRAMDTLNNKFQVLSGYSDHSLGIEVALASVSRGAVILEKHLTLNKLLPGPDHRASLEPIEFKLMVKSIRNIEKALGSSIKKPVKSEEPIKRVVRKSLVAACDILKGVKIKSDMLAVKRPGTGIEPKYFNQLIGKTARVNIKKDKTITKNLLH